MGKSGGAFAGNFADAERSLVNAVRDLMKRASTDNITGRSKLTSSDEGQRLWSSICQFVYELTGKTWIHKKNESARASYRITDDYFCLPEGDVEALIHDMCHWLVATPEQRDLPNLGLDPPYRDKKHWAIRQEELAWALQVWIFSAVMG